MSVKWYTNNGIIKMMIKGKSDIVKEGRIRTGGGKVYKSLGGD